MICPGSSATGLREVPKYCLPRFWSYVTVDTRSSEVTSKLEHSTLGRRLAPVIDSLLTSVLWLRNSRESLSVYVVYSGPPTLDTVSCALFCLIQDSCPPPSCICQLAMLFHKAQLLSSAVIILILWHGKFRFSDMWLLLILRASDMLDSKRGDIP